jgi:hypothetical protein
MASINKGVAIQAEMAEALISIQLDGNHQKLQVGKEA